jgi:hypothetical protein
MQPNRLGRILGIGARVAGEKLRDGTAGAAAAVQRGNAARTAAAERGGSAEGSAARKAAVAAESGAGRSAASSTADWAQDGRRLARGAGRFGAALWKPLAHATGQLGLQITGVFFAFFAVGFGARAWQLYHATGWHDRHLALYAGFSALFAWFTVSSFWRAKRKQKRG